MKRPHRKNDSGVVLVSVLALLFCACVIVSMLAIHSMRSMLLTRRRLQYQRAATLSESALGYAVMAVRNKISDMGREKFEQAYSGSDKYVIELEAIPDYGGTYDTEAYFIVENLGASSSTINSGDIKVTARAASTCLQSGVVSAVQEEMTINFEELGDYAAFYDGDLEAHPGATMQFVGKVHSNGNLYLGGSLQFDRAVTCAGSFYSRRKNGALLDASRYTDLQGKAARNGTSVKVRKGGTADGVLVGVYDSRSARYIDSDMFDSADHYAHPTEWGAWYDYYNGAIRTSADKVHELAPPISVNDDNHSLIERSGKSTDPIHIDLGASLNVDTEEQKFANKAALKIVVKDNVPNEETGESETILKAYDRHGNDISHLFTKATVTSGTAKNTTTGAYNNPQGEYQTDNYFWDVREQKAMAPVDLYLDQVISSAADNAALFNVLFNSADTDNDEENGIIFVTRESDSAFDGTPNEGMAAYDYLTEKQVGTGQFNESSSTDTKTTTDARQKDNYVRQGYTLVSSRVSGWTTTYTLQKTTVTRTEITETVTVTNKIPVQPCLRIRNGADLSDISATGLSIVSDLPVYVEGCFNTDGTTGSANDTTIATSTLVAGDAVSMLSRNWKDSWTKPDFAKFVETGKYSDIGNNSAITALGSRTPTETTFNGIIMTGIVPTTQSTSTSKDTGVYSGGLENVFRFMENWRDRTYNFNGSIICMWDSEIADGPWRSTDGDYFNQSSQTGGVYSPPTRKWGYARMSPPGLPSLLSVTETRWRRIDYSEF